MTWRPAPSVALGLSEATRRWPNRSKASDGIIGDAAHSSRTSDHNPDENGVVHAFDLTHDPDHGVDCHRLAAHLVRVKDRRVRYIIWNRRIIYGPWSTGVLRGTHRAWAGWEPYTGPNPHDKHMHVSVGYSESAENDLSPWWDLEGDWLTMVTKEEVKDAVAEGVTEALKPAVIFGQTKGAASIGVSARAGQTLINEIRKTNAKLDRLIGILSAQADSPDVPPASGAA